jgi:uncharacterized protein YlxP (DUF503 family)
MFHIGVLQFTVDIPHATSLKDKRRVVRGMKDRMRRHFNVSVAEVEDLDVHNVATMAAVMAGTDVPYLNGAMDQLLNTLRDLREGSLGDFQLEIVSPG